jgi:quinolinate synthase
MKLTTLVDVLNCLKFDGGKEIDMSEEVRVAAKNAIDRMLELGDK